jgi:RND family efflux transporter MFP subunit
MQKSRLRWLLLLAVIVVAGWLVFKPKQPAPPVAVAVTAAPVLDFLPQEVMTVSPLELRQTLSLSGSLRAIEQASVKARVAGEVREVLAREGEAVKAGQIIVKMDTTEYQARLEQGRGNLNAMKAQLEIATKTRDNNRTLLEKGFISRNAFDNAASQFEVARANVDAAQAALDVLQKTLNDTVIRAPISGLVASRSVQPGEKVSPDNRLLELVNLQQMEMEAAVPTSEIASIRVGQQVSLRIEGLPETFDGRVARINPGTQSGSRSVMAYIVVANPQTLLRGGMFAQAQLTLRSKDGELALPYSAVHKDSNGSYVYAIDNGLLIKKAVVTGNEGRNGEDTLIEIRSGLVSGDQIIRNDMGNLRPGTAVRISKATMPAEVRAATAPAAK